jgi:hypothetical protein
MWLLLSACGDLNAERGCGDFSRSERRRAQTLLCAADELQILLMIGIAQVDTPENLRLCDHNARSLLY